MTIIAAISRPDLGYTVIGSDRRTTATNEFRLVDTKWVMLRENCWIGCCGSYAFRHLIRAADPAEIMCGKTVPIEPDTNWAMGLFCRLRNLFLREGVKPNEKPGEMPAFEFSAVLVAGPNLYEACEGLIPTLIDPRKAATCGSGAYYADGAYWALRRVIPDHHRLEPDDEMSMLLRAAEQSPTCGPEHWIGRVPHRIEEKPLILDVGSFTGGQGALT